MTSNERTSSADGRAIGAGRAESNDGKGNGLYEILFLVLALLPWVAWVWITRMR